MEQEQLVKILEALLFVSGKPLKIKDFIKILELEEAAIKSALDELGLSKKDCGVVLLESNGEYQLTTNSQYSTPVKNFLNAELREKLTDATVEVLSIIAYRQPISKAEIEAIRGVSSQYSLRNLLIRGMIEKVSNPGDARSVFYQTTTEFLMHLGLNSTKDLPEFEKLVENIKLPSTPGLSQTETAGVLEETVSENAEVIVNEPEIIIETVNLENTSAPTNTEIIIETSPSQAEDEEEDMDDEDEEDDDEEE